MTHTNTKEEAPGACSTEFQIDTYNDLNAATVAQQCKAITTQIAELALRGHAVHKGRSGDYLVSKYGLSRYCQDSAELKDFARQLGVPDHG